MVSLKAGDNLSGLLSWPGNEDLDIYLYSNGTNLLDFDNWVDR